MEREKLFTIIQNLESRLARLDEIRKAYLAKNDELSAECISHQRMGIISALDEIRTHL